MLQNDCIVLRSCAKTNHMVAMQVCIMSISYFVGTRKKEISTPPAQSVILILEGGKDERILFPLRSNPRTQSQPIDTLKNLKFAGHSVACHTIGLKEMNYVVNCYVDES